MKIESLDHLVLTVRDFEATCEFYQKVLGMGLREFKPGRFALHFGDQKLNIHEMDMPVDKNVKHPTPGSADLCFLTKTPLEEVLLELKVLGIAIVEGQGQRTGAQGPIHSIYVYDPDENLIEIANRV